MTSRDEPEFQMDESAQREESPKLKLPAPPGERMGAILHAHQGVTLELALSKLDFVHLSRVGKRIHEAVV